MKTKSDSSTVYCRLCLDETKGSRNHIDARTNDRQIHDKILQLFHFAINEADYSPFICLPCLVRVESIVEFMETVHKNQEKLRSTQSCLVKQESQEMDVEYSDALEDSKAFQVDINDVKVEKNDDEVKVVVVSLPVPKKKARKKEPVVERGDFSCDICSKLCPTKAMLVIHMKRHMEPTFACDMCSRRFQSAVGLACHKVQSHEYSVDISKFLLCDLCQERPKFESFETMNEHYLEEHGTRGYVQCCNKKLLTKRSVVYHAEVHARPTDFMCVECERLFPNKYSLKNHMIRHKPEEEKQYKCEICSKRYHLEYDLKLHVRYVHERYGRTEEKSDCLECNKQFSSKFSLYLHNRRFHMNLALPMCETCGKQCRSKGDLRSHINARHTDTPKTKCDICGNMVKNIRKHKQIHVESALHIKCEICGHETTTFKYLRLHMKIHSDEKPHVCATCGQSFKRKKSLDDHMSIHSGIPRHFCNYCDRTFNNSGNKFKHIKQAHPAEAALNRRSRNFRLNAATPVATIVNEPVIIEYQVNLSGEQE